MARGKRQPHKNEKDCGFDYEQLSTRIGGLLGIAMTFLFAIWILRKMWEGITTSWPW